ncbi:Alpha/Beta hydrolase protein [Boeremia exigua]|uniref:Alpha/Beta hydrolase protein n=1 Tax=Boeremia exigua TaxID=749465 RepID=UPI001E8EED18|nr:Alpha/Beta hydrolase protein [Boeremia exigua]KAH6625300.1 Alpha/Beta hydrolase protein [Boeremia exigua]
MPHSTSKQSDAVLEFLCDRRFHQQFTYVHENERRRVTYSDYGDSTSKSVILFFGGLMGARFSYSPLDQLARKHNVRIIHPDRPGVGGSDPTTIENRIPTYIDMVPRLLSHLGIEHVALASHSFGTIYLLNTMLAYPHLLHPRKPYVAFFAPWVHPEHTGIRHLQAAEMLPGSLIGKFSSLAQFVNDSILPLTGMSAGLSSAVVNSVRSSLPQSIAPDVQIPLATQTDGTRQIDNNGLNEIDLNNQAVVNELRELIPTFLFAEGVAGAGQDTQLCLRKPRSIPWCTPLRHWDDHDDAVRQLRQIISTEELENEERRAWQIETFHAETDSLVGKNGQTWFDGAWTGEEITESRHPDAIRYSSRIVKGSDHDFILDPAFGASETWLKQVSESFTSCQLDEGLPGSGR